MKKVLAVAALALVLTSVAQAQTQTANITVNATVAGALSMSPLTGTLDFGTLIQNGPAHTINPASDASAIAFTLTGGANAGLNIHVPATATLLSGANTMPLALLANYSTTNTQASGTALTLGGDTSKRLSSGGAGYMWLGGTVTPAVAQAAGAYTVSVTVTAAYTGM